MKNIFFLNPSFRSDSADSGRFFRFRFQDQLVDSNFTNLDSDVVDHAESFSIKSDLNIMLIHFQFELKSGAN
jgi:hypothetical protein